MGRKGQTKAKPSRADKKQQQDEQEVTDLVDKLLRISTTPTPPNVHTGLQEQRKISTLSEEVIKCQSEPADQTAPNDDLRLRSETVENFNQWIKHHHGKCKGVSITSFTGYGLGLKADVDISQGSLVIAIPRKLMMNVDVAKKTVLGPLIERDHILKNMPNVALAMFLLLEKFKEDSFWKPYIDILPREYSTVLYFDVKDLEELQGSPTLDSALKQIKNITRQYAYFHRLFSNADDEVSTLMRKKFTLKEYRWAVSTVMTRQNTIPGPDGKEKMNALIPLWDLCNHTNGTISTDYNTDRDRSECMALRDFKSGEQLFIFYGARSNADLFVHNGFVYEENVHDGYWLPLGVSKSDALQEMRGNVLKKLSLPVSGEFWLTSDDRSIDGQMLAFLRVFNMSEDQLWFWLNHDNTELLYGQDCDYLDKSLDVKVWNFLKDRIRLLMATYKTSLEEDLKLLKHPDLTSNRKLAIRMRASEKRIFEGTLKFLEGRLKK